jgi:hypothetical protein
LFCSICREEKIVEKNQKNKKTKKIENSILKNHMPSTLPLLNFTAAAQQQQQQQQNQSVFADVLLDTPEEDNNFGEVPATSLFASLPDEHESLDSSFSNSSWELEAFGSVAASSSLASR